MNAHDLIRIPGICLLRLSTLLAQPSTPWVVIHEVHHDDVPKTSRGELIEIYNADDVSVDLSGWTLEGAGNFTFPPDTALTPDQFLVIAEDISTMRSKFKVVTSHEYDGGLDNDGELLRLINHEGVEVDRVDYKSGFPWPTGARGAGASMELIHPLLDNDLGASWRSSNQPTPGKRNSVYNTNAPPLTRQVMHLPQQPRAGEKVTVTAKVTDVDGINSVILSYQIVEPGSYVRKNDSTYERNWTEIPMRDDGTEDDELAEDNIFSGSLPAEIQIHRRLIRYRILVEDTLGNSVQVPYSDDESPNFAYFVYEGVPGWSGAKRPRVSPKMKFPKEMMANSLPVYHLIADMTDVENSQYNRSFDGRRMGGTLVYDGIVYDHIQFYNRGEASTYVSGKNKWRFRFNRARDFLSRDIYGKRYKADWKTMNLNACASPWVASNRGIAGLDEAVPHRLYQLACVPSSNTHWIQFRIIDDEEEAPSNQYSGDLWGLYLAIEHPDSRFLAERNLPDRSTYEIAGNLGDKKNQGPDQPLDNTDWDAFWSQSNRNNPVEWWRTNFDLQSFYGFRAINRATGNVDLRDGANYYMFQHANGRWTPMPWDLDMMYAPVKYIWSGVIRADRCLDQDEISIDFKNRCRELIDLLFSDISRYGGQAAQLVQELSTIVNPPQWPLTMVDVDEAMWSYHSRTSGSHRGPWYQLSVNETRLASSYRRTIPTPDHEGFQRSIIDYMFDTRTETSFRVNDAIEDGYGFGHLSLEASASGIPDRPRITYSGGAEFPVDGLNFTSSSFVNRRDTDGFASMEWRIGEISNPEIPGYIEGEPWVYEIEERWHSGPLIAFLEEIKIPNNALRPGHTYRARVRHFNTDGHSSRWSAPIEFVASEPDVSLIRNGLVISEIMYHPSGEPTAEFIELHNVANTTIDLTGLRFTKGIDFDFQEGTKIASGDYLLIIGNVEAFEKTYGSDLPVAGVWNQGDLLSNSGENIKLSFGAGIPIIEFEFGTMAPWPITPDGNGQSLQLATIQPGIDHNDPAHWKASTQTGGSPGKGEGIRLADWLIAHNLKESDLQSDHDGDGLPALLEYGIGGDPGMADSEKSMTLTYTDGVARLIFHRAPYAIDVAVTAEFSKDLTTWHQAEIKNVERSTIDTLTATPPKNALNESTGFFRLLANPQ